MKNRKLFVVIAFICLAVIVAVLPFASACSKDPGEQTLKIGISTPSTGPAAEKGSPMGHANLDAIKYVNEELGGVDGHPVEVVWLDNAYDASKIVTNVKRFMDQGCLMYTTSSSKMMSVSMETANRAEFPGLACFTSPMLYRPPQHIYGQLPDYGDDALAFTQYFMKNIWKGSGKLRLERSYPNKSRTTSFRYQTLIQRRMTYRHP